MKIATVVGTRPQFIKSAVLLPALEEDHEVVFIDTGQHWSRELASAFIDEFGLRRPDYVLGCGEQLGEVLFLLEPVLLEERPDVVVVYGDTNSTLAGALAASKLDIPVAHVEAGLRSFDRRMPEETNRVITDHLATWCFAPTPSAVANLASEGITKGVVEVGDLMQDLAYLVAPDVRAPSSLEELGHHLHLDLEPGGFIFATVHRAENRTPDAALKWMKILASVAKPERPVILAVHPGTAALMSDAGIVVGRNIFVIDAQGYRSSLCLQLHASAVITDSGGIQRESAWLGTPCLVLRSSTEWTEAVSSSNGKMTLIGVDVGLAVSELDRIAPMIMARSMARHRAMNLDLRPAGAAPKIISALQEIPCS